jgi:hypothetical protein
MEDPLYIVSQMSRLVADRRKQITEMICEGSVPDWAIYQKLRGRLEELTWVQESLRDLARKESQKNVGFDSP